MRAKIFCIICTMSNTYRWHPKQYMQYVLDILGTHVHVSPIYTGIMCIMCAEFAAKDSQCAHISPIHAERTQCVNAVKGNAYVCLKGTIHTCTILNIGKFNSEVTNYYMLNIAGSDLYLCLTQCHCHLCVILGGCHLCLTLCLCHLCLALC